MSEATRTQSNQVTEGLTWLRELLGDDVEGGYLFRRRGAWGDATRRFRRLIWRLTGAGDFHPLERDMTLINLAVLRGGQVELWSLRGRMRGFDLGERIAAWPAGGLHVATERRTVRAVHDNGTQASSTHTTRIVIVTIEPPGERALQIDMPDAKVTTHFLKQLRGWHGGRT